MQKYFQRSPDTLCAAEVLPRKAHAMALSKGCLLRCVGQGGWRARREWQAPTACWQLSPRDLPAARDMMGTHRGLTLCSLEAVSALGGEISPCFTVQKIHLKT